MGLWPKSMKTLERSRTQRKLVALSIIIYWHWTHACTKFNPQTADALVWWISRFPRTNDANGAHENTLVPNAHSVMRAVTIKLAGILSRYLCRNLIVTPSSCIREYRYYYADLIQDKVRFNTNLRLRSTFLSRSPNSFFESTRCNFD